VDLGQRRAVAHVGRRRDGACEDRIGQIQDRGPEGVAFLDLGAFLELPPGQPLPAPAPTPDKDLGALVALVGQLARAGSMPASTPDPLAEAVAGVYHAAAVDSALRAVEALKAVLGTRAIS